MLLPSPTSSVIVPECLDTRVEPRRKTREQSKISGDLWEPSLWGASGHSRGPPEASENPRKPPKTIENLQKPSTKNRRKIGDVGGDDDDDDDDDDGR